MRLSLDIRRGALMVVFIIVVAFYLIVGPAHVGPLAMQRARLELRAAFCETAGCVISPLERLERQMLYVKMQKVETRRNATGVALEIAGSEEFQNCLESLALRNSCENVDSFGTRLGLFLLYRQLGLDLDAMEAKIDDVSVQTRTAIAQGNLQKLEELQGTIGGIEREVRVLSITASLDAEEVVSLPIPTPTVTPAPSQ